GPAVVGVSNGGQAAGLPFTVQAASPTLLVDSTGNATLSATPARGAVTIWVNGAGEVSPALKTAYSPGTTALTAYPKPVLPLSVTVGGIPCFVVFEGITPGLVGVTQVNLVVPPGLTPGLQPVVVTVGGVASPV